MFKKTEKSLRTRERILEAASQSFAERGFEQTTLRDISAATNMGLGAVYYYYKSKEELLLAFYEQINEQVTQEYRNLPHERSLGKRFTNLMELKLRILSPHRKLLRIILKEAVDPESPLCPLSESSRPMLTTSLKLFREVAGEGARALWVLHMTFLGLWLHDKTPDCSLTRRALASAATLLDWSVRLTRIPGAAGLKKTLGSLLDELVPQSGG